MWLDFSGSSTRTSTPRWAASLSASTKSWSGRKYAVVSQTLVEARLIASRYIARIGNIISRGTLRWNRTVASQALGASMSSGGCEAPSRLRRLRFQKSANARFRSTTPGPVIRRWVSRHSVAYAEPMLYPPMNAAVSSTTRILRWSRP